jgi:hypothetical protein
VVHPVGQDQVIPGSQGGEVLLGHVFIGQFDPRQSYNLGANCYIVKPCDLDQLATIVKAIENFWFTVVKLPPR